MKPEIHISTDTVGITLYYPRVNSHKFIEASISDVRADDGIRLYFDFDRDGWVVQKPTKLSWEVDEEPDPHWKEVAFIQGWMFINDEK